MSFLAGLLVGGVIGCTLGLLTAALLVAAKRGDEQMARVCGEFEQRADAKGRLEGTGS